MKRTKQFQSLYIIESQEYEPLYPNVILKFQYTLDLILYLPIFHVISGGGLDPSAKQTNRYSLSTWNIFGGLRILTFFGITEKKQKCR